MARGKSDQNAAILEYALHHLERERDEIQAKIDHVKRQLGWSAKVTAAPVVVAAEEPAPVAVAPAAVAGARKKRVLSPAARKRIALAQKRRWAAHRKAKAAKE